MLQPRHGLRVRLRPPPNGRELARSPVLHAEPAPALIGIGTGLTIPLCQDIRRVHGEGGYRHASR